MSTQTQQKSDPQDIRIASVWSQVSGDLAEEIMQFWRQHHAMDEKSVRERAGQLVAVVRDAGGSVIAVSTAHVAHSKRLDLHCYYYRQFIAPSARSQYVARELLAESTRILGADPAVQTPDGPSGVLLEIYNKKIDQAIRDLVWKVREFEFIYVGRSLNEHTLRVAYFSGKKIPPADSKAAPEPAANVQPSQQA
jgi:hypothetical protein